MKKATYLFSVFLLLVYSTSCKQEETMAELTDRVFAVAKIQSEQMAAKLGPEDSPRTFANGRFVPAMIDWWCSGFFPGTLWQIYEYTQAEEVMHLAKRETAKIESLKYINDHHDVGFQINCSFGHQYRLLGDTACLNIMRTTANSLSQSFSPVVGCIKSWPFVKEGFSWVYPVIVDNMMNLELLMMVGNMDNNEYLRTVAISHADKTMEHHFRKDYTSWHLVDYDPEAGTVNKKITVQGLGDETAWARGQAWAVYGYTMMFEQTSDVRYLHQAQGIADMLVSRLPADGIPYWDFDSPKIPDDYRDASAAAIMASAFIALTQVADNGKSYMDMAEKQLRTLSSPEYLAEVGENGNFLLKHSVGSQPDGVEIDVPLTYADYYYLEALLRYMKYNK